MVQPMRISAEATRRRVSAGSALLVCAYEVLVVDIAAAGDSSRIAEFEKDARQFNALHKQGYTRAKPYFNLLHMANGQIYFVFGFRGDVQGIHRHNYPGTVKNLQNLTQNGNSKYHDIHWLPVEEIRKMMTGQ